MSRTRATSLVLVNWRGVFYERYQLDRHVTALEGANGSGKTTVMIAAYLCLLEAQDAEADGDVGGVTGHCDDLAVEAGELAGVEAGEVDAGKGGELCHVGVLVVVVVVGRWSWSWSSAGGVGQGV